MLTLANDVGLYAEEYCVKNREFLGNFPQAFTHMAIITSCAQLALAKQGKLPQEKAYSFASFLLHNIST